MTVIDYGSSRAKAVVLSDKRASTTAAALKEMVENQDFKTMELLTDNGKEWEGDFGLEVEALNLESLKIIPHCPSQNGRIERFNKYLKKALKGKETSFKTKEELQLAVNDVLQVR